MNLSQPLGASLASVFTVVTMDTGSRDMSSSLTAVAASQGLLGRGCARARSNQTLNKYKIQGSNAIYIAAGHQKQNIQYIRYF